MLEEGLFALVGLTISAAVLMYRDIGKKIDRAWIVGIPTMILFLIFCMAAGIFTSYFVLHIMIQHLIISRYELLVLSMLTFFFCLISYSSLYRPVFKEWHEIMKETVSKRRTDNLRRIVDELNDEVAEILRDTPAKDFTREMVDKILSFTASKELLNLLEKNQRNLKATRVASYLSVIFSLAFQVIIEILKMVLEG